MAGLSDYVGRMRLSAWADAPATRHLSSVIGLGCVYPSWAPLGFEFLSPFWLFAIRGPIYRAPVISVWFCRVLEISRGPYSGRGFLPTTYILRALSVTPHDLVPHFVRSHRTSRPFRCTPSTKSDGSSPPAMTLPWRQTSPWPPLWISYPTTRSAVWGYSHSRFPRPPGRPRTRYHICLEHPG